MGLQAKEAAGTAQIIVLGDRSSFDGERILECEGTGVLPCVPKVDTSGRAKRGLFMRGDFLMRWPPITPAAPLFT
jgi:hypothetical protein